MNVLAPTPIAVDELWGYAPVLHLGTRSVVGWEMVARDTGRTADPWAVAVASLAWADRAHGPSRRFVVMPVPAGDVVTQIERVEAMFHDAALAPDRVAVLVPPGAPARLVHALEELGVGLVLRDPDGAAATAALHDGMPIDRLVLGAPRVDHIDVFHRDVTVLRSLVQLAGELGVEVVVDDIVTRDQLHAAHRAGAALGQGGWFGAPTDQPDALVERRAPGPFVTHPQPRPPLEAERLRVVHDAGILDSRAERSFDDLAQRAAAAFDAPIALVTIIDAQRQWAKACVGSREFVEVAREHSFCAHAVCAAEPLVVPDALRDERFSRLRPVTTDPWVRFYAGAPMLTSDGLALGTVCVLDTVPRPRPTRDQLDTLESLALVGAERIELRARLHQLRAGDGADPRR